MLSQNLPPPALWELAQELGALSISPFAIGLKGKGPLGAPLPGSLYELFNFLLEALSEAGIGPTDPNFSDCMSLPLCGVAN